MTQAVNNGYVVIAGAGPSRRDDFFIHERDENGKIKKCWIVTVT